MKKVICTGMFLSALLLPRIGLPQQKLKEQILAAGNSKSVFDKKFRWGVSFNSYWSTIEGQQVEKSYFVKPSLGGTLRAEYYFNSFLGIGFGVGFQQRGAGIYNQDNSGGAFSHPWITNDFGQVGNPDSTYLQRLRFSSLEFPLTFLLRTPKDISGGLRLSAAVGPTLIHTSHVNLTYQSIVDGFHPYDWITENYLRNDLGIQASAGVDIDSGGGKTLFQMHLVYTSGLGNIYAKGQGEGRQVTYGVRLAWLF